jgi:hypothetical protein
MPFSPSEEILEACERLHEDVERLQRERRAERTNHEQVPVMTPSGPAEVDRGMVSLLQCLWDHGVATHMSCEDNMGSTWICFDLREFQRLHHLARALDDLAYFVDSCHYTFSCQTPEHAEWEYPDSDGEDYSARLPPLYHVNMRFPKRLHDTFEQLLDEALAVVEGCRVYPAREGARDEADLAARREERAARWAAPRDRSRSPRGRHEDAACEDARGARCHRELEAPRPADPSGPIARDEGEAEA